MSAMTALQRRFNHLIKCITIGGRGKTAMLTGSLSPDRELKVMNIGTGSPSGDREPVNGIVFQ